jgi:hypothetical protein
MGLWKVKTNSQAKRYMRHASDVPDTRITGIIAASRLNKCHSSNSNVQDQYGCFIHNTAGKIKYTRLKKVLKYCITWNVTIIFGFNLSQFPTCTKFFIYLYAIHLLKSSTCFEQYAAHLQEVNRCTGQSPANSDDIRCCIDTIRPPEDEQRTV